MTNKIAMRGRLADAGVPQPRFAAVRTCRARAAAGAVGFPAVSRRLGRPRGHFLFESLDDVERHLRASLVQSTEQEAILESYHEGKEVDGLLVLRDGEPTVVTLSDRAGRRGAASGRDRPRPIRRRSSATPMRKSGARMHTVKAPGLREGIASTRRCSGARTASRG